MTSGIVGDGPPCAISIGMLINRETIDYVPQKPPLKTLEFSGGMMNCPMPASLLRDLIRLVVMGCGPSGLKYVLRGQMEFCHHPFKKHILAQ